MRQGGNWINCHCRPRATKNICCLQQYLLLSAACYMIKTRAKARFNDFKCLDYLYNKIILVDKNLVTQASFCQPPNIITRQYFWPYGINFADELHTKFSRLLYTCNYKFCKEYRRLCT